MRIISGKYGSRRFPVPSSFKARPTTDKARESLFDILSHRLSWPETDALDLFAGTGGIGFEMLSRGARSVLAVERDFAHFSFIKGVASKLADPAYRVLKADVLKWLPAQKNVSEAERPQFELIFADPPYALPELPRLYDLVLEAGILRPGGLLVLEHPGGVNFSGRPLFYDCREYGADHFSFFKNES